MADASDVETALVAAVQAALAPGPAGASTARVYRGAPAGAALSRDLAANIVNVTVTAVAGSARNTTRWAQTPAVVGVAAGITASACGDIASFSGSAVAGELAGVLVDGAPFLYQAQAGDSAGLVAAALADAVRTVRPCMLSGNSVTIPGASRLIARSAGAATIVEEWSRQEEQFRLAIWAPSPAARDTIGSALAGSLAQIAFLTLADGTAGRLRFASSKNSDDDQVAAVFRRDLTFTVEYGTTAATLVPTMLFGDLLFDGSPFYA